MSYEQSGKAQNPLADRTDQQIRLGLLSLAEEERMRPGSYGRQPTHKENLLEEAATRIRRFENLCTMLGKLAPKGTAHNTALEQIYQQADVGAEISPIVLELRAMLAHHYGEWTPAIAEAEGIAPTVRPGEV